MSVVANRTKGLSAWFTAFAVLFALVIPFAGTSLAASAVDANPESQDATAGQPVTITVTGGSATDEIDFEIDCISNCAGATYTVQAAPTSGGAGGSISAPDAPTDGDQTPQNPDDTRTSPEMSCVTSAGGNTCSVTYTRSNSGVDYVAAWHDGPPGNNAVDESDPTELPNNAAAGGEGAQSNPDSTDVVQVNWSLVTPGNAKLDCDDDGAAGDINDQGASDTQNTPTGSPGPTYTCLVWNDNGAGGGTAGNGIRDGGEQGISGIPIDVELAGANDPDNLGFGVAPGVGGNNTADVNNACTTGADGGCTFTSNQTENETGATTVCAWADTDNDAEYNNGGAQADGEQCDNEVVGDAEGDDLTDLMMNTWVTGGTGTALDADPEYQAVVRGGQVAVNVLVQDALGNPVANFPVDVNVTGRNAGLKCDNKLTGADGRTTCNYTDSNGAILIGTTVTDTIDVCQSTGAGNQCASEAVDNPERDDLLDTIQANFYNSQPTVDTLVADADANDDYPGGAPGPGTPDCNGPYAASDTHGVNVVNVLCADITPGTGSPNPSPGQPVTFTITSGPGYFFEDFDEGEDQDTTDTNLGSTVTVNANNNGSAFALFNSQEAGTTTITVSSGGQTVTLTKTVTGRPPRNIMCTPETAETAAGQSRTFTCKVTDRFGQPTFDALVGLIESGPGNTGPNTCRNFDVLGFPTVPANYTQCSTTNAQGEATFTVGSSPEEEGTQTLIFEIIRWTSPSGAPACPGPDDCGDSENPGTGDPANDIGDPCDQAAGRLSAEEGGNSDNSDATGQGPAPAGNCEDTSTNVITQPEAECEDAADNDGDGFIDFPDDPGCTSATDDSEQPFNEPEPTEQRVGREVRIFQDKHERVGRRGSKILVIKGVVNAPGATPADRAFCGSRVNVDVQIRAGGEWVTRKSDTTQNNFSQRRGGYIFKVAINDVEDRYRALAPKIDDADPAGERILVCSKASDKIVHGGKNHG